MTRVTVSISDQANEWIESKINEGEYESAGDYLRDLILIDRQQHGAAISADELRQIVAASRASGPSSRSVDEIFDQAELIASKRNGSP